MALDLVGGSLFSLLYDGVKQAMVKTTQFKSLLADLKSTLDSLQPRIIEQIGEHNTELGLSNEEIEDLKRQMEEGVKLVGKFSEFRVWNYCCIGDYTDQLIELDRALRRLLEMLRLQEARDVKETLLLSRQNRDKLDEVNKRLIEIQKLLVQQQQQAGGVTEATDSGNNTEVVPEPIQGNGIQVAELDGGVALEAVFGMLFDAILEVQGKAVMFKTPLGDLKSTLDSLKPLIEEIAQRNKVLVRPKEELEKFKKQMEKGVELIPKCSKVHPRASCKKSTYTETLIELDKFLQRQLYILKMQVARDVRNTLVSIRNIEVAIEQIEKSGVLQNQVQTEGCSTVSGPSPPTVGLDVVNVQGTRDVEETMSSIKHTAEGIKPVEESGVVQIQLETKGTKNAPKDYTLLSRISRAFSRNIDSDTSSGGGTSLFSEGKTSTFRSKDDDQSIDCHILETSNLRVFSFAELKTATRNFRAVRMLSERGFGKVFKGWLDETTLSPSKPGTGMAVAIKKLDPESCQGWQAEVNFLGRLSHPNLIKLLGYCWEYTELFLVHEFMPKGSLDNHLFRRHPNVEPLSWEKRIKIAIGAARGLAFLHSLVQQIIHKDFKTSNILLDGNYNAKLSDFGLAKLGPTGGDSHVSTMVMGTYGYAAPEYIATGHLYVKSDVYGFGVVLLELLTGLRAHDPKRPQGQVNLVDWAKPLLSNERMLKTIIDARMEGQYSMKAASRAGQITLKCLPPDPKIRPSMKEVVEELEQIQAIKK
ncbi:putative transferase, protein kinase RLK-Pelle-RLCK-VIIa-2 family [Rosa chinensis]|uniref:Putative transferase, protein kinase RLK-Pelle-RLCK-VIIa-2 family n=1 Tax=Rosa chinensis TaxID=74649 RepID=A0A2P6RN73_ROSCH|nr:protein kinase 3 isoform X2 [Rosa chinensis]PRQ47883.1 putative transferase, protein kinase RLK-Pelle-RLCK-VIIa-2 family [Rosa chinensis]